MRSLVTGLGAILAFATAGCVETGVGAPARGPDPAVVGATLALDLRNPDAARESVFGDVILFSAPGIGVAVAVDGGAAPGTQDGYVDQVFLLQQQEPARVDPRLLRSAELFYAGRLLMVRAPGAAPVAFMVQGTGDPVPAAERLPFTASGAQRLVGFGMSRRTGAWQIPLDEVTGTAMATLLPSCATATDGGVRVATTCDSGGEGSTSCSTSCPGGACSTSCGSGFYSCCNMGACTCTCVASGGGGANPKPPINATNAPPGHGRP
jgi:hypothetical protein